ncbi:hypothetical protein [Pandoravirus japonicus]|uniref:Uncharacterized protein n=1 Tax=Pandoravirus japonicus TaxID=2823154 RepID=A0A811BM62_9VIRU|nr:hypothetical protein [Pandoravirus japonicus]
MCASCVQGARHSFRLSFAQRGKQKREDLRNNGVAFDQKKVWCFRSIWQTDDGAVVKGCMKKNTPKKRMGHHRHRRP